MEAAASSNLTAGSVFAGRYRVERRIAEGGMGAVYEVVHIETNRRRALKVMHAQFVQSDELRGRFRQEARVAAEIESEHIVDVFDAGIDEATGMPFLVMELLRGEELGKLVKRVGALPKEDVVRYLYETSLALDKTHRARIVHRDLKPDNLFLCERDQGPPRVKVLDFGIAKIVKDAQTHAQATRSLGTPLYMAPEQFQMQSGVTAATDIYALGLIAFTLLAGKPYWFQESRGGADLFAFMLHAAKGPIEPPVARAWMQYGIEIPAAFDAWFVRATARDPVDRFATAGQAVLALADALGVASPADGPPMRAPMSSYSVVEAPAASHAQSTVLLPETVKSSPTLEPRTGPTQMAMTPGAVSNAPVSAHKRAQSQMLALMGIAATLVVGLGSLLVIKVFGGEVKDEPRERAVVAASLVPAATNVAVVAPAQSAPIAAPEVSAAAPTSSAGQTDMAPELSAAGQTGSSERTNVVKVSPPSVTGQTATKPAGTATSAPVVKKTPKWTLD